MLRKRLDQFTQRIIQFSSTSWFVFLAAILCAADAFLFVMPPSLFLVAAVLGRPNRWILSTLIILIGSALGSVALAAVISHYGLPALTSFFPNVYNSPAWNTAETLIHDYSFWGLTLITLSPLPQQTGAVVAGFSQVPLTSVFLAVCVGRGLRYLFVSALARFAPAALDYFKFKKLLQKSHRS